MYLEKTKLQILASTLILVSASSLTFSRFVLDNFNIPKLPLVLAAGTLSLLSLVVLWIVKQESISRVTKFSSLPFLSFIISFLISWLFGPASLTKGFLGSQGRLNGFALYGSLSLVALAIILLYVNRIQVVFDRIFVTTIVFQTIYCLLQITQRDPVNWDFTQIGATSILGTLGNPNFISSFMAISAIYLVISSMSFTKRSFGKWGRITLAIISFWIVIETGSLQGQILILAGIYLILVLTAIHKVSILQKFNKTIIVTSSILGLLVLVAMSGTLAIFNFLKVDTLVFRLEYMKIGIKMFLDNPIFGVGIDSFGENFRRYRSFENFQVIPGQSIDNPHNLIISLAACCGFLVAVSKIIIVIYIFLRMSKYLRSAQVKDLFLIRAFICWTLFELQALISIDSLGLAPWSWIFAALVIGRINHFASEPEQAKRKNISIRTEQKTEVLVITKWILALITSAALAFSWQVLVGNNKNLKSLRVYSSSSPGLPNEFVNEKLVRELYNFYRYESAYSRVIVSDSFSIGLDDLGEEFSKDAALRFPAVYEVLNLRAKILEVTQRSSQATILRRTALEIEPLIEDSYINYASNLLVTGKRTEGIDILKLGVRESYATSYIQELLKSVETKPEVGRKVTHNNFGVGIISSVTEKTISVNFINMGVGEKTFDLQSAPLTYVLNN